jgi:hypothetical protein
MTSQRLILLIVTVTTSLTAIAEEDAEATSPTHCGSVPWLPPCDAPTSHRRGD